MKSLLTLVIFLVSFDQGFEHISFDMTQRRNIDGKTTKTNAKFYFGKDGRTVAHYFSPLEFYMINNKEGEMRLYNPAENTVFQVMNHLLSSQNNPMFYFLTNKTDDMGLKSMNFELTGSELEDGLLISYYKAPVERKEGYSQVELVHKGRTPVFLGYLNDSDQYIKKVFYYDYQEVGGFRLPKAITEIEYLETGDSAIAKTNFENFKLNTEGDLEFLNFEVPETAQLIE